MLLGDLSRIILLTASILVAVIAFAVAVKPLADGKLEPTQALRFMALAIPPMLQFALPFAVGFGSTLVFHRFAADNEATAAMTGGVSHRALLAPAALMGLALALVLLVLTGLVIPGFLRSMERLVTRDIARMLVNAAQSGQSVRLPDNVIVQADRVSHLGRDAAAGPGAPDRLLLEGVVAVQTSDAGVEREAVAERAGVWIYEGGEGDERTQAVIRLYGAAVGEKGQALWDAGTTDFRVSMPGGQRERPKYYPTREMLALLERPERIGAVETRRHALVVELERGRRERALRSDLQQEGSIALRDAQGQWVSVRARDLVTEGSRWRLEPQTRAGTVDLVWRLEGGRARLQFAQRAWLRIDDAARSSGDGALTFTLDLEDVATSEGAGEGRPRQTRASLGPLHMPGAERSPLLDVSARELLARVEADATASEGAKRAARALRDRIEELSREVRGIWHERLAYGAACFVMALSGAAAGLRLGESRVLLVCAWSFFPSVATLITIGAGQNMTHKSGPVGLALLWGGVACLGAFVLVDYARLRRH